MSKDNVLSLKIKAIDSFTAPLREMTAKIEAITAPTRNAFKGLGKDVGDFGKALNLGGIGHAAAGVGGALKNVGGEVFSLGAKLAAVGAAGGLALGSVLRSAMEAGDELSTVAERVGMGVDAFASLRYAAAQADVDQETFNASLDKLNKHLGEFTVGNGGEFLNFLNQISPTFAKQMKGAHGTEQAMALLTDAFSKITDPAKRAELATQAFGKSGAQMGVFMAQGSAAVQKAQVEWFKLHGSQESFAKNASDLDNALKKNGAALEGLRDSMAGALFPAVTKLSNALTEFFVKHRDGLTKWAERAGKAISEWVDGGGLQRLGDTLGKVGDAVGAVVDYLGPLGTAIAVAGVALAPTIAAFASLGGSLFSLAGAAMPAVTAAWGLAAPALTAFGASAWAALAPIAPFVAAGASLAYLGKTIYDNWGDISQMFKDWAADLEFAIGGAWQKIKPYLEKFAAVKTLFNAVTNPIGFAMGRRTTDELDSLRAFAEPNQSMPKPRQWFGPEAPEQNQSQAPAPQASFANAGALRSPTPSGETKVTVNFSNMPKGARVSTETSSSQPVDVSTGYAMSTP